MSANILAGTHLHECTRIPESMDTEFSQSLPRDILTVNVTTVIGTHAGPNGLGLAAARA